MWVRFSSAACAACYGGPGTGALFRWQTATLASRTRRQMIQRMGRVLRKKPDGRLARIAIVYVAGSFEDPQRGAHEAFLDAVRGVADDCRDFRPGTAPEQVTHYLADTSPAAAVGHQIFVDRVLGWNAS
jgi:hypothetical protein